MRTLAPPPPSFVDTGSGEPVVGSFAGGLPAGTPAPRGLSDRVRRKAWLYLAVATDDVWLSAAIVDLGYATNAFVFVAPRRGSERGLLFERTLLGPPGAARVTREVATFERRGVSLRLGGAAASLRLPGLELAAAFDAAGAPPAIGAVVALEGGAITATEKRALLAATGTLALGDRRFTLDGGVAGYDFSTGFMPRRTRWRWAFALGRTAEGEPVAFNVVEGFVGEAECALFARGSVRPLVEPRFVFDPERPLAPWRIEGKGIDLTFTPRALYAQRTNLLLVRSRFVQPAGVFHGTIHAGGKDHRLEGVAGVVEDQDVLW